MWLLCVECHGEVMIEDRLRVLFKHFNLYAVKWVYERAPISGGGDEGTCPPIVESGGRCFDIPPALFCAV